VSVDEPALPREPVVPVAEVVPPDASTVAPVTAEAVLPSADADLGDAAATAPPTVAFAGAFVAGLAMGLVGAIVAASRVIVRGVTVPVGLVLVLLAVGVVARGMAWYAGSRRAAAFVALGWVLPTAAYLLLSPGGDVLLPDNQRTTWYLLGSALLLVTAMIWPLPRGASDLAAARRRGTVDPPDPEHSADGRAPRPASPPPLR